MPKIKDLPKHKRPREKLAEKGAENLSDAELMAIYDILAKPDLKPVEIQKIKSIALLRKKFDYCINGKTKSLRTVYHHVYRSYPTVPSPFYEGSL